MTIRRTLIAFRVAVIVAIAIAATYVPGQAMAAGTAVVTAAGPGQVVAAGTQFTVKITVQPNNAIAGVQFNLTFNPSLVTANNVTEGNLLKQGGASTYFQAGQIDNVAGAITGVAGAITSPGQTVSGSGTFATITFTTASAKGTSSLNLSGVIVGDINGQALGVSATNGQVSTDRPPVLNAIGNKSVNEGALLSFTISGSDPDGDTLTYSASNLPSGATFTASTRTFSWTPTYSQAGSYSSVHFQVSDGSLTASEDITITVVGQYLDWDPNIDGAVNVLDMITVGQRFGETGTAGWIRQDVNGDGSISVLDMTIIGQHWTG